MKVCIVYLLVLIHLIGAYYVDVREATLSSIGRASPSCKPDEMLCSTNCRNIAKCINGIIRTVSTCPPDQFCNDDNGPPTCGSSMGFKCFAKLTNIKFKCASLGFFPDVIACNKYHFCYKTNYNTTSGNTTTTPAPNSAYDPSADYFNQDMPCDGNTFYSLPTSTCEPSTKPCPTTFPVRLCKTPGEMFQVNGPIYVICQQYSDNDRILYPFQYRCKTNKYPCPFE
ncbi:hypothetical protein RN001_013134 [Aquatica leii]|uniref:Uncharacterized protein n=1 Tax=Aquatica leii TaxID=1421715 RepID=A0AAN7NZN4_9COLE|nr:hypothetical protein RN001_013134 [Aquatica leii]